MAQLLWITVWHFHRKSNITWSYMEIPFPLMVQDQSISMLTFVFFNHSPQNLEAAQIFIKWWMDKTMLFLYWGTLVNPRKSHWHRCRGCISKALSKWKKNRFRRSKDYIMVWFHLYDILEETVTRTDRQTDRPTAPGWRLPEAKDKGRCFN